MVTYSDQILIKYKELDLKEHKDFEFEFLYFLKWVEYFQKNCKNLFIEIPDNFWELDKLVILGISRGLIIGSFCYNMFCTVSKETLQFQMDTYNWKES